MLATTAQRLIAGAIVVIVIILAVALVLKARQQSDSQLQTQIIAPRGVDSSVGLEIWFDSRHCSLPLDDYLKALIEPRSFADEPTLFQAVDNYVRAIATTKRDFTPPDDWQPGPTPIAAEDFGLVQTPRADQANIGLVAGYTDDHSLYDTLYNFDSYLEESELRLATQPTSAHLANHQWCKWIFTYKNLGDPPVSGSCGYGLNISGSLRQLPDGSTVIWFSQPPPTNSSHGVCPAVIDEFPVGTTRSHSFGSFLILNTDVDQAVFCLDCQPAEEVRLDLVEPPDQL